MVQLKEVVWTLLCGCWITLRRPPSACLLREWIITITTNTSRTGICKTQPILWEMLLLGGQKRKYLIFWNPRTLHVIFLNIPWKTHVLQLNCPADGHWEYAGIFAVKLWFQIRDQFWIPHPKLHGAKYFFVKPQNGPVTLCSFCEKVFPGSVRAQNWPFELKSMI